MTLKNEFMPRPWIHPSNYIGATWEGWLVFLSQNRDSDALTRSNFEVARKRLGKVMSMTACDALGQETVQTVRESHWAVGWVEWIAIHPSDTGAVKLAEEMARKLDAYPVLDEDHLSQLETDECNENWGRDDVERDLIECGVSKRTISNLPAMDREDAAFILDRWVSDFGADTETDSEGSSAYYRVRWNTENMRDAAAWAIRWLRSGGES